MFINDSNGEKRIAEWVKWYAIFMIIVILWHFLMYEPPRGDAIRNFSKFLDRDTLGNILINRYETWSSRLFLEAAMFPLSRHITLWKVFNVVIYGFFGLSILKLTHFKYPVLTLGLWLIYPVREMSSAGWLATYMNYFWPLAIGIYALIALDKIYFKEKIKPIEGITYILALLFATNVEQENILFIGILLMFGIDYYIIQKSRDKLWFYMLQLGITFGNLVFILVSPGNAARKWVEVSRMNDFGTMGIIDKGVLGLVVTMNKLIADNTIFFIFVMAIFVSSLLDRYYVKRKESKVQKTIIEAAFVFPFLYTVGMQFSWIQKFFLRFEKLNAVNWPHLRYYALFIIYMLIIISIIISLLNLFNDERKNMTLATLFGTGLLTRVVMGFSPTLYESGSRTFIFLDAVLIFILIYMFNYSEEVRMQLPSYVGKIARYLFLALVCFSIINNTFAIWQVR